LDNVTTTSGLNTLLTTDISYLKTIFWMLLSITLASLTILGKIVSDWIKEKKKPKETISEELLANYGKSLMDLTKTSKEAEEAITTFVKDMKTHFCVQTEANNSNGCNLDNVLQSLSLLIKQHSVTSEDGSPIWYFSNEHRKTLILLKESMLKHNQILEHILETEKDMRDYIKTFINTIIELQVDRKSK